MNQSASVFRIQFALFKREKGMLIFYLLCTAVIGIVVPSFLHSMESCLTMALLLTVMYLKPLLSDSLAGERERRTLESLLSTSINEKSIIWGKFQFGLLFALAFFAITIGCAAFTNRLTGYELNMMAWQWVSIILLAVFNFSAISLAGVYLSATSQDLRIANGRVSRAVYPLGLLFLVYLSVIFLAQPIPAIITGFIVLLIYLCIILVYTVKVSKIKQSNYFEHIKGMKSGKKNKGYIASSAPKSQFGIVFNHELKYLWTLKTLLLNFLLLCVAPAIIVCLSKYYTGQVNLGYAVLLTTLIIPRVPTNLIAYSIGGEKTYKTGESLLSTPVRILPLFLAKCAIPVLTTAIMLTVSSLATLAGANVIGKYFESCIVYTYTADQLVLLFPVSIMSCITMVFITGILSVNMKTPRQGLYIASAIGFAFVIPPLAIVYLTQNTFMWSVLYFIVLLLCNTICMKRISDKISRPQIMSKL